MSRHEQNILFGALMLVTAIVLAFTALTVLAGGGQATETAAVEPAAPEPVRAGDTTVPTLAPSSDQDSTASSDTGAGTTTGVDESDGGVVDDGSTTVVLPSVLTPVPESRPRRVTSASTTAARTPTAPTSRASTTAAPTTTTEEDTTAAQAEQGTDSTEADSVSTTDPTDTSPSDSTTTTTSPSAPDASPDELNPLELEIHRLTNELRTDPNGPLVREGEVPDCDGELLLDADTGEYEPVDALILNEVASLEVARPWSEQMTRDLRHQPQAGSDALRAAGLNVGWVGENVSFNNYPNKAMQHFVGWRESDGHFCNMMNPVYTHIGVGETTRGNGDSFATQSFFTLR